MLFDHILKNNAFHMITDQSHNKRVSICRNGEVYLLLCAGQSCPTYLWLLHWLPYLAKNIHNPCVHSGLTASEGF